MEPGRNEFEDVLRMANEASKQGYGVVNGVGIGVGEESGSRVMILEAMIQVSHIINTRKSREQRGTSMKNCPFIVRNIQKDHVISIISEASQSRLQFGIGRNRIARV